MNSVPPDDDIDIEMAWRKSSEVVSRESIDRLIAGTLSELRTKQRESAGFYWVMAAALLIGVHFAVAVSWSSSFAWNHRLREPGVNASVLLARQEMMNSLDAELRSPSLTYSHAHTK